ncbi:30S ribosomal protein S6 [Sphingomonas sp. OTU376]|uniref:30S ribosomal protein S6 n=1 Tax=Sphingomonas sp. OTU376 TaxID=3043863 RepID=UPI00406C9819
MTVAQARVEERRPSGLYEYVFLARQDLAQAQVDALAEAATKIIEDNNGKVVKTETWGLRSLAYRIAKNRKAHYVMLEIEAPAGAVAELERQTQINEDVIRYMTVKVDKHETGPSVMMRKGAREQGAFGSGDLAAPEGRRASRARSESA